MSKKSFWSRLFSGTTEGATVVEPQADANGSFSFSAEQFTKLTHHLEGIEASLETATEVAQKASISAHNLLQENIELKATIEKHTAQFAKLAIVPAVAPVATTIEPVATTEPEAVDPLNAKLKAMMR